MTWDGFQTHKVNSIDCLFCHKSSTRLISFEVRVMAGEKYLPAFTLLLLLSFYYSRCSSKQVSHDARGKISTWQTQSLSDAYGKIRFSPFKKWKRFVVYLVCCLLLVTSKALGYRSPAPVVCVSLCSGPLGAVAQSEFCIAMVVSWSPSHRFWSKVTTAQYATLDMSLHKPW